MAFVLEIGIDSSQEYIKNYIVAITREYGVRAQIVQKNSTIICTFASDDTNLKVCLEVIEQRLPASCFLKTTKQYESKSEPDSLPTCKQTYPLNLALCPTCQKEMFDPSSRRYYYPFTSCTHCGGQHSFLINYPFKRENTSLKFFQMCDACREETLHVGIRESHHLNSCHKCGIPVRALSRGNERYANDAGSFRTMFEVAAKAIVDRKKVLIKTTFGYRLFYLQEFISKNSIVMMINAQKITHYLSLINAEFNALLSIERPILHVTLSDEELKSRFDANTAYVKYPDEGFSILLGVELQKLGIDHCAYEVADANTIADIVIDYDVELRAQSDMRLFLNKDISFIAEGERVSFPSLLHVKTNVLSVAHDYVNVQRDEGVLIDKMEFFDSVTVERAIVLEDESDEQYHSSQQTMSQDEASFMSVIAEHNLFGTKCVGAHFDEEPSFLYYDGKRVMRIVPPKEFDAHALLEKMATLREGADRLVTNIQMKMPLIHERLVQLQDKESTTLFEAVATILGLEDATMRGVSIEAMKFIGKGGIQIDTHVKDNRFDHIAFLSSIVSYQLAGVSSTIISYSIFESLGDYFSELLHELQSKTKATNVILCGTHFANQSLFSRMQRNFKNTPLHMNRSYPIGKENAVVGGVYL